MWKLYKVTNPIGNFFGVARNMDEAREHWGLRATIVELSTHEEATQAIINQRVKGNEKVFIAI